MEHKIGRKCAENMNHKNNSWDSRDAWRYIVFLVSIIVSLVSKINEV